MITPRNSVVIFVILLWRLVLLSSASQLPGNIARYDAELHGDVFTSAILDHATGALYASTGAGLIHRFSTSLKPTASYPLITQPALCDHETNQSSSLNGTAPATDVTTVVRLDSTSRQLLACGGRCGLCSVLNVTTDVEPDQHTQPIDPTSSASYVSSRVLGVSPVMVFSARNSTNDEDNATKLFVAGATAAGLEAVSVRARTPTLTGFDVVGARFFASETFADSYRFVDALDPGDGFIYFVAVRRYARPPAIESRLVRVCRNDVGRIDSYTEVKLSCQVRTLLRHSLNVAVAAHVGPVGANLAWQFQLEEGEPAIYVVVEDEGRQRSKKDTDYLTTSGICVYTMRQVRNDDFLFHL